MPIYKVSTVGSRQELINAAYAQLDKGDWVSFKTEDHKLVKAFAQGVVHSIELTTEPDGKVTLDLTTKPWDWLDDIRETFGEKVYDRLLKVAEERLQPPAGEITPIKLGTTKVVGGVDITVKPDIDPAAVRRAAQRLATQGSI